jgi:thioredoxin 2
MPVIRACHNCGTKNRIPAKHLASIGRCAACKSPLQPVAEPLQVDDVLFDEVVQNSPVPVFVDFWAQWCGRVVQPRLRSDALRTIWQGEPWC